MKKLLFIAGLFICMASYAQYPPGYTGVNSRYDWLAGKFRALTLPAYGDTALQTGQARIAGAVLIDTTGDNKGMYVWYDRYWHQVSVGGATPTLQQVLDAGNTSTTGAIFQGTATLSVDRTGGFEIVDGANSLTVTGPALGTSHSQTFANASGIIPISVNGNTADANGNITVSTGGSSDSTLQQITHKGNSTDTSIRASGIFLNDTYGLIWSDNFTGGSLGSNYVDASSSTETFTGAGLELDGTANVYTNAYYRTDSSSEQNTGTYLRFQVKEVSADSYGTLIGFGNLNALCCDHHWYGGVSLTNGTKTLRIQTEGAGYVYNDATALTIAVNDTIELWAESDGWNLILKYYNHTTKFRHSFTLTGVPQGSVLPTTPKGFGRTALVHLGGNILIQNWARYSNESKNAKILWIGESLIAPGGNVTDPSDRLPYLLAGGNRGNVIIYGGGGSVAYYNRAGITSDFPRYTNIEEVYLMGLGNDTLFSVYENQGKLAYTRIRDYWVGRGVRVIHVTETPRDALAMGPADAWIKATFASDPIVSLYDRYRNGGTTFPAPWDAGDGVHWSKEFNRDAARYMDSLGYGRRAGVGEVNGYTGKFRSLALTGHYEYNFTGNGTTIPPDASFVTINPPSVLSTFAINLPYAVDSGKIVYINFGGTIATGKVVNALTITTDASQTQVRAGFVTPMTTNQAWGAGDWIVATYKGNNRWDVLPMQTRTYTDGYVNGHRIGLGNFQTTQSNLVFGYFAGNSTATGAANNTLVGSQASQNSTSATGRTIVGAEAGLAGNSSNITAIGYTTFRTGAGNNSSAVGYAAGYNATSSATGLALFGYQTGFDITSGTNNSGFGGNSLRGVTTGSGNLGLGNDLPNLAAADAGTIQIGANALRRWWSNSSGQVILGGSIPNTGGAGVDTVRRGSATVTVNGTLRVESVTLAASASSDSTVVVENGLFKHVPFTANNYTPTITGVLNYTSSTDARGMYTRQGNFVDADFYVLVTPTAGSTPLSFQATLPVASDLSDQFDLIGSGVASHTGGNNEPCIAFGDIATNIVQVTLQLDASTNARGVYIHIKYEIK